MPVPSLLVPRLAINVAAGKAGGGNWNASAVPLDVKIVVPAKLPFWVFPNAFKHWNKQ